MEMTGEYRIEAPREKVWEALNDPTVLQASIPGCEELQKSGDDRFEAKVRAKVGPVSAKFSGVVTLSDIKAPESYTISGEGKGGAAGFAKGGAKISLSEDGADATILRYEVEAKVGGKLAQLGSRLIDGTAKKMAGEFFANFAEQVTGSAAAAVPLDAEKPAKAAAESTPPAAEETPEMPPPSEAEQEEMTTAAMRGAATGHTPPQQGEIERPSTEGSDRPRQGPEQGRTGLPPTLWLIAVIAVLIALLALFM